MFNQLQMTRSHRFLERVHDSRAVSPCTVATRNPEIKRKPLDELSDDENGKTWSLITCPPCLIRAGSFVDAIGCRSKCTSERMAFLERIKLLERHAVDLSGVEYSRNAAMRNSPRGSCLAKKLQYGITCVFLCSTSNHFESNARWGTTI
jgi:hypothetical protein